MSNAKNFQFSPSFDYFSFWVESNMLATLAAVLDDVIAPSSATTHIVYLILYNTSQAIYQRKNLFEML